MPQYFAFRRRFYTQCIAGSIALPIASIGIMKSVIPIACIAFAAFAVAAPLNINLGAYSPALVVGDGAIGFKGAEGETAAEGATTAQGRGIVSG